MKERERILELVKQGVISTEEALVLLESAAAKQGVEATVKEEQATDRAEAIEKKASIEEAEEADRKRLEAILENLATEVSQYSAELDVINSELNEVMDKILADHEKIMIIETMGELDELTPEQVSQIENLHAEVAELNQRKASLEADKKVAEENLNNVKKQQKENSKKSFTGIFDLPDDWKENASETLNQVGGKVTEAGSQFGKLVKDTFTTVMENVDWKDVNIKVPGLASTKFEHVFNFPETEASIIRVKLANGDIQIKHWDSEDIKIEAKIKVYGKTEGQTPFEAFLERSTVEADGETLTIQIPNKRVAADLVVYLPKRTFDYTDIKLLNGSINVENLEGKDIFAKSTNGSINLKDTTATLLEIDAINGSVNVTDGNIRDLLAKSVNGSVTFAGNIQSAKLATVNGTVRATVKNQDVKKIEANSVRGSVKVAVPEEVSVEGEAKTNLGNIQSRLKEMDIIREKREKANQLLQFRRVGEAGGLRLDLSTTTGNIQLKDSEQ